MKERLRALGITQVFICGTQYPNCICVTAFDAVARDFLTTVILMRHRLRMRWLGNIYDMQQIGIDCLCFAD